MKTAEGMQLGSVVHPQVAGQIVGARQVHPTVVTKLTVVVLKEKYEKKKLIKKTTRSL